MNYRFIITDLFNGGLRGTDDEVKAREIASCEDFFVYDSAKGNWLYSDGTEKPLKEFGK